MKITIDCRHIDSSGIGVYLKECLPYFFRTQNYFILLGNIKRLKFTTEYKNTEIIQCRIKPYSLCDFFLFPSKIAKKINSSDLFYSPNFNIPNGLKIPIFTTIHDIVFPDMPKLVSKLGLIIRMWFFHRAYKKSSKIFTVSNFSKERIEFYLGKNKPVIVTHSAIQTEYLNYRAKVQYFIKNKTIIFIGNMKKNKGLVLLLKAFKEAKNDGLPHRLIIIGGSENFRTADNVVLKIINSFKSECISLYSYISNELLMKFLSEASLLIQPSLYEGFCLPPLEALMLGTPALISDIPVLKEIYSDFPVIYFKSGDPVDLKNKMMKIINNNIKISLPDNLSEKYTFDKTSSIVMENITAL